MPLRVKLRPPKVRAPIISPRRPEIIIGIPAHNEEKTISDLTKTVDDGLRKYFPKKRALIILVDSASTDGTKRNFLGTKTKAQKKHLRAPLGKGKALKELFNYFLSKDTAQALATIDGDVTSATPRWVRNLITPIQKGFDHNFPIFNRHEFDGSITNHLAYPVVRGVLGIDIRQPLAGEVGLSRKAVDRMYNRTWPAKADKYGVDIFMAFSSVLGDLRISETYLGVKEHKPGEPKLYDMFGDVATALFTLLDENRSFWDSDFRTRKPPVFFKDSRTTKYPLADIGYRNLVKLAKDDFALHRHDIRKILGRDLCLKVEKGFNKNAKLYINETDWVRILFAFITASDTKPIRRAEALRPLYYARFLSFYKDNLDADHKIAEKLIKMQADLAYKERGKLLSGIS